MRIINNVAASSMPMGMLTPIKAAPEAKPKTSLRDLCTRLHDIFSTDEVCIDELIEAMESYDNNLDEWKDYLYFDPNRYTRNLVDAGNKRFNVIVLGWSEGQGSPIHDHAGSHCVMKILDGDMKETQFHWPSEADEGNQAPLRVKKMSTYKPGDVAYIHDDIGLHRVENPSHARKGVSLHVYCPPILTCEKFDERTSHHQSAGNVTFYSVEGTKLPISAPAKNFSS